MRQNLNLVHEKNTEKEIFRRKVLIWGKGAAGIMKVRSFQLCVVSVNRVRTKPYSFRSFLKKTWCSKFFVTNFFVGKINLISTHSLKMQSYFFTLVFAPANFDCFDIFSFYYFSAASIWIQIYCALFRVHCKPNEKSLFHF